MTILSRPPNISDGDFRLYNYAYRLLDYSNKPNRDDSCLFNCSTTPNISILDFLIRLIKYIKPDYLTFILSFIYLDRISYNINLTYLNIHRFYLISLITAVKYNDDFYFDNLFYAKCGGLSLTEFNKLEIHFLIEINWILYSSVNDFKKHHTKCVFLYYILNKLCKI
tara:strand:+ start:2397 stop:2897 length:501 start_codon:yes stop_codon:yes gene_type:complete